MASSPTLSLLLVWGRHPVCIQGKGEPCSSEEGWGGAEALDVEVQMPTSELVLYPIGTREALESFKYKHDMACSVCETNLFDSSGR